MPPPRTLHLIGQAHLDPVWLWPWSDGCSEALTTIQSAVNFLETEPDFCFTRSSAEIYRWVQRADPRLFARIKAHVAAGRWEIVGGWIEQPDCNLPSTESFVRQSLYGKTYFRDEFGVDVRIGYNVDSFGHAAELPQLLAGAGFTHYVFMRPQAWEAELPTLFWWEGSAGARVLTWRLPQNYGQTPDADADNFEAELRKAAEVGFAPGMNHGMFFYGVGNHGGGPTRAQLERIRRLQQDPDLPELRFSTVGRFFAAIENEPAFATVPVVRGELQKHAPGCYSAHATIKRENRRAERRLFEAEAIATAAWLTTEDRSVAPPLQRPWEHLLLNQFHDILGGTCTAPNDASIRDRFGAAIHAADETATLALHRLAREVDLTDVSEGALLLWNPLPWPRLAPVSFDTFTAPGGGAPLTGLTAPDGRTHPIQWTAAEPCFGPMNSAWHKLNAVVPLPAGGYRVFLPTRNPISEPAADLASQFVANPDAPGLLSCFAGHQAALAFTVWADPGDTWGHRLNGYDEKRGAPDLVETTTLCTGPVVHVVRQRATWQDSELIILYRQWAGVPGIEITVRTNWREPREILRLEVATDWQAVTCTAAIPGGSIRRADRTGEQPANEWVALSGQDSAGQAKQLVLASDGGLSHSTADGSLRVIVIRTAYYAHHQPKFPADPVANPRLDEGWQETRYWLAADEPAPHRFAAARLHTPERVTDSAHPGTLPREASFWQIMPDHVALVAVKPAEAGDGWVLRLLETAGRATTCRIEYGHATSREVSLAAHALVTVKLPWHGDAEPLPTDLLEQPLS
ncbi:MAG: glycoside hydrolase family 38 C-terminal domain-containing protein [Opitutaceae bacterium]